MGLAAKKGPGRPAVLRNTVRRVITFDPKQWDRVCREAKRRGVSASQFVRDCIDHVPAVPNDPIQPRRRWYYCPGETQKYFFRTAITFERAQWDKVCALSDAKRISAARVVREVVDLCLA